MAKIATAHTQYYDDNHTLHTLVPGQALPKGHDKFVKNPKLFAEAEPADTGDAGTRSLAELKKPELVALAKDRGLPVGGTADEIRERLAAADVEAASPDGAPEGEEDLDDLDREALVALAGEHGVTDFTEETSDAELVALIENARG